MLVITNTNVWTRACAFALALSTPKSLLSAQSVVARELATPEPGLLMSLLKTGLSLGGIIVLLILALRLLARWNASAPRSTSRARIEVLESRRLEPKRSLHVVRIEGRRWLVASCEGALQLEPLPGEEPTPGQLAVGDAREPRGRFAGLFLRREVAAGAQA